MTLGANHFLGWLLVCEEKHLVCDFGIACVLLRSSTETRVNEALGCILRALSVNISVTEVLPAERADKFVLLELPRVSINESRPLVHLMPCFLVKFILIVVVFLFEFL